MNQGDRKKVVIASVAGGLALILGIQAMFSGGDGTERLIEEEWFYDLEAKELIAMPRDTLSPVKDKPSVVKAFVFACGGNCGEGFTGYLFKMTPEAMEATLRVKAGETPTDSDSRAINDGQLVADPESADAWHSVNAKEGIAIQDAAVKRCPGGNAKPCYPD